MFHLIQENVFKEHHHDILLEIVAKNKIDYEIVRYMPFTHDIEFTTVRKDVWCWGSVNLSKVAHKYGWYPGVMYNANHDFEVYAPHYGENMLNHDGIVVNFGDTLPEKYQYFFARPTADTKSFSGQLFSREKWEDWVQEAIANDALKTLTAETKVLIAPLKDTQQEVRCWVIGGKVISASRYKLGGTILYENYDNETFYTDFAQKMVDIYQPAEAFVLDVCLSDNQLKVVEINCINCSGFYHVDMYKLIEGVENHFNHRCVEL